MKADTGFSGAGRGRLFVWIAFLAMLVVGASLLNGREAEGVPVATGEDNIDRPLGQPSGIVVTPPAHNYLDVTVGNSVSQVFSIRNAGSTSAGRTGLMAPGDLEITSVTLGGTDPGEFSIDGFSGPAPPFTLRPGATNDLTLSFSPTSAGIKTGSMTITSNDPNTTSRLPAAVEPNAILPPVIVPLGGNGVAAAPAPAAPVEIPTLSGSGIVLLGLVLLVAGVMMLRRSAWRAEG